MDGGGLDSSAHLGEGDALKSIRAKMEARKKEREAIEKARANRAALRASKPLPVARKTKSSSDVHSIDLRSSDDGADVLPRKQSVSSPPRDSAEFPPPTPPKQVASSPARDVFSGQEAAPSVAETTLPHSPRKAAHEGWFSSIASTVASAILAAPAPAPVEVIEANFLQHKSRAAIEEIKETLHLEGKLEKVLEIILVQSQVVDAIEVGARKRIVELEKKVVSLEMELAHLKARK